MDPEVLQRSRRGHTPEDTVIAVGLLVDRGYEVGLQIMAGLPGDNENRLMETGRRIAELAPDSFGFTPPWCWPGAPLKNGTGRERISPSRWMRPSTSSRDSTACSGRIPSRSSAWVFSPQTTLRPAARSWRVRGTPPSVIWSFAPPS